MIRLVCSFLIVLALICGTSKTHAQPFSDQAKMSLLTAGPGEDLYAVFGHSALWVYDPELGIDEVYNWGVFDFDTPNFYLKFLRGKLHYKLVVTSMRSFMFEYQQDGRAVYEQVLNLDPGQMQDIYSLLLINRRPENIYYLYDFFYDNCATRIRDIIDKAIDIDWGPDPHPHRTRSFREMLHPYVDHIPWIRAGIDLALGLPSDKIATPWHYMYLPDEMFIAFQHARHPDGRLFVDGYEEIIPTRLERSKAGYVTPTNVSWLLLLLGALSLLRRKISKKFAAVYMVFLGLLGIPVFFMWFLSDHVATAMNLNLLWTLPTHIFFVYRATKKEPGRMPGLYFLSIFAVNLLLLATWSVNPQGFNHAYFPLIGLSAIMSWVLSRHIILGPDEPETVTLG